MPFGAVQFLLAAVVPDNTGITPDAGTPNVSMTEHPPAPVMVTV